MTSNAEARIVFSYGCPRTGTTFMRKMLARGEGYIHAYIREYDTVHPCNGGWGLFLLARCLGASNPLFIRTVRNPLDIFASFYALNHLGNIMTEKVEDETIYSLIREESQNSALQSKGLVAENAESIVMKDIHGYPKQSGETWFLFKPKIITVKYENLANVEARSAFLDELASRLPHGSGNRTSFLKYIEDVFLKVSVRKGRLKSGIGNLVPEKKRDEIRDRLKDVFVAEGYDV